MEIFAHYIDNDIAKIYIEIVKSEILLGVPEENSFFFSFIKDRIEKMCISNEEKMKLLEKTCRKEEKEKIAFLTQLCRDLKMGTRGHCKWDGFALALVYLFVIIIPLSGIFTQDPESVSRIIVTSFLGEFILLSTLIFIILLGLFHDIFRTQRDPNSDDF